MCLKCVMFIRPVLLMQQQKKTTNPLLSTCWVNGDFYESNIVGRNDSTRCPSCVHFLYASIVALLHHELRLQLLVIIYTHFKPTFCLQNGSLSLSLPLEFFYFSSEKSLVSYKFQVKNRLNANLFECQTQNIRFKSYPIIILTLVFGTFTCEKHECTNTFSLTWNSDVIYVSNFNSKIWLISTPCWKH